MNGAMRAWILGAFLVGCHGTGSGNGTDASPPDMTPAMPGLNVSFATKQARIPGNVTSDVVLTSAKFVPLLLRVIGDATSPGDLRTSSTEFDLSWSDGHTPPTINFPSAPPGLYSNLSLEIDGLIITESYDLKGTVVVHPGDSPRSFRIHDRDRFDVDADSLGVELEPNGQASIDLVIDFAHAFEAIDWTMVHVDDGVLDIDTTDGQIAAFRSSLQDSFHVERSGQN
jgi:hypothetical protein